MMLPLSLLGRGFYRRKEEGKVDPRFRRRPPPVATDHKEIMTSTISLNNNDKLDNERGKEEIFGAQVDFTNSLASVPFIDGVEPHVKNTGI